MVLCCGVAEATPLRKPAVPVAVDSYTRAEILSPADDAAVRSNAGTLTVLVRVDP